MAKKIKKINPNSKIRVIWKDLVENYSKQKENEIIRHYKNLYKVNFVTVDFKATNSIKFGAINIDTNEVENINSPEVQERILVDWLKENKTDIEISDIKRLNKNVEGRLNELNVKDNKWMIKSLEIENFLSYGEKITLDFDSLKGITVVNGKNFSGKTTILSSLLWLLYGSIEKAKTFDDVINSYNGANSAMVSGIFVIENEVIKIERSVERKFKKNGEYSKTNASLKFMKLQPDGTFTEDDKEEDRNKTEKKIRENIGTLNEFLMTIICTGDNIFDVIKAKATERGQTLSRFLGLEIFERKLEVVKTLYNEWKVKAKLTNHNTSDLEVRINDNNLSISASNEVLGAKNIELKEKINIRESISKEIDTLEMKIHNDIDSDLANKDDNFFINEESRIKREISNSEIKILELNDKIKSDLEVFNITEYNSNIEKISLLEKENFNNKTRINTIDGEAKIKASKELSLEKDISRLDGEMTSLRLTIRSMKNDSVCPECAQAINTEQHQNLVKSKTNEGIEKRKLSESHLNEINILKSEINVLSLEKNNLLSVISNNEDKIREIRNDNSKLKENEILIKENDILILTRDKNEVDIERFQKELENNTLKKNKYELDKVKINENKVFRNEIFELKYNLSRNEELIRNLERIITENNIKITNLENNNIELEKLIVDIRREEHISKVFEVYMLMVGKNGISKSILKKCIPILNLELSKFLKECAEFTVEVEINEKNNEVEFWKVDNETGVKASLLSGSGYEKTVSSLAIRIVMSKINTLPKPSLLFVDEIFSTVDNENLDLVKIFFEKLVTTIDNIFIITHNDLVKDWADNIINVTKVNNISKINL